MGDNLRKRGRRDAGKQTEEKKKGYGSEKHRKHHVGKDDRRNDTIMHQFTVKCITVLL